MKKGYKDELLEEYIQTRQGLIKSQERLFYGLVFLGMVGLVFLVILLFAGWRLDLIDFFSNLVR